MSGTRGAALVATLLMLACQDVQTRETGVELVRPGGRACRGNPQGAPPGMMNTHLLELYEVLDPSQVLSEPAFCQRCFGESARCQLRRQECVCGGDVPAAPEELSEALTGVRIAEVPGQALYCMRITSFSTPNREAASAKPQPCACDPSWPQTNFLRQAARLCSMGIPRMLDTVDVRLDVRCPNDVVATGSLFDACVLPRAAPPP